MIELKVPSAGESITEVTISEWLKEEGALANSDETVAVIETDKANVDLVAPATGRISRILKSAGESAAVGEVIGYMETGDAKESKEAPKEKEPKPKEKEPKEAKDRDKTKISRPPKLQKASDEKTVDMRPKSDAKPKPDPKSDPAEESMQDLPGEATQELASPPPKETDGRLIAPPSVRRAMREQDVDPRSVRGSGPAGRISMEDVAKPRSIAKGAPPEDGRETEVVPMTQLRKRIAERLVMAQQTAALLTTFNEIDMSAVMALRKRYQESFVEKHGIKLGFMSFFVKAAIEALKELPALNAEIRGDDVVYHNYFDVGVAVGGGRGLVVPVIRNAELLSFSQIEKTIADFGQRAKDNKLKIEELTGGTFTISNGGVYGSLMSTPIVNPPQSGILGMHAIQERPVVRDGQIAIAPMMYVALTYDHRIVDGREAVTFLVRIKECIEQPARILLEV